MPPPDTWREDPASGVWLSRFSGHGVSRWWSASDARVSNGEWGGIACGLSLEYWLEGWLDLKLGVSGFGYCKIFFFLFFCNYDRIARLESRVRVWSIMESMREFNGNIVMIVFNWFLFGLNILDHLWDTGLHIVGEFQGVEFNLFTT